MKGATAEPSVNTKRAPNNTSKIMIGASHHFLRTMRESQESKKIETFDGLLEMNLGSGVYRQVIQY